MESIEGQDSINQAKCRDFVTFRQTDIVTFGGYMMLKCAPFSVNYEF